MGGVLSELDFDARRGVDHLGFAAYRDADVAFYMLLDWHKMITTIDNLIPPRNRKMVRTLARQIDAAMAGFLRGHSLVYLCLGIWYGVGLSVISLNFGLLIGISAGALSFIPYVRSIIFGAAGRPIRELARW
jgi:predicted PurR-regulated permease PerM